MIRPDIQHYQEVLKRPCQPEKRRQLLRPLAEAQTELPLEPAERG